jgi:hypothetical protein
MPKGIYKDKTKYVGGKKGRKKWIVNDTSNMSKSKIGKKRLPFSTICKERMSKSHKGKHTGIKSNWWIKDRTKLKKSENKMNDYAYKIWVKEVRTRDKNECRLLNNECKGRLETHHIFSWKEYPNLRYLLTNGITLCAFHHPRGIEKEKRMIPIFQELLSVSKEQFCQEK